MDKIKTDPVQLVGRVRSFRRTARVSPPANLRIVGEAITDVQIPIKAEYAKKELKAIAPRPLGFPAANSAIFFDPKSVSIILKGPQAILEKLNPNDLLVYVEVDGLQEGIYKLPLKVILPSDIVLDGDSPMIDVLIKKPS